MAYTKKVNFTGTGRYGNGPEDEDDVYTVKEFASCVDCGAFIDYDGYGHPVKDGLSDTSIDIRPSTFLTELPEDATHIIWFNR